MNNQKTNWLVRHAITVFSCVLIIALGIAFISRAVPVTTTIGENIATNDLSVAGNVTSGTWQGTAVGTQYGGTGADWSAVAQGNIPYFSGAGTLSNLAPGTAGQFLKSQGAGADPFWANVTRSAIFVVAASDSSALSKQQADYVCDGTDDQVEIQAAIDALPAVGGLVHLAEGTFYIGSTVFVNKYNLTLEGEGANREEGPVINATTLLRLASNANTDVINLNNTQTSGVRLRNFGIDGNKANQAGVGGHGLNLTGMYHGFVDNIAILNAKKSGIYANNDTATTWDIWFQGNVSSLYSGEYGVYIKGVTCVMSEFLFAWHSGKTGFYGDTLQNLKGTINVSNSGETGALNSNETKGIYIINSNNMDLNLTAGASKGVGVQISEAENSDVRIAAFDNVLSDTADLNISQVAITGGQDNRLKIIVRYTGARSTDGVLLYSATGYLMTNTIFDIQVGSGITRRGIYVYSAAGYNYSGTVIGGRWTGATPTYFTSTSVLSQLKIDEKINHIVENSGASTITAGQTSVDVTHGLATTPTRVQFTPTTDTAGKRYWISAKGATTFTITIDSTHTSDIFFDWRAVVGEGN